MYDIIRGPLVGGALIMFVLGSTYQVVRFYALSSKVERLYGKKSAVAKSVRQTTGRLPFWVRLKLTVFGAAPVVITVSLLFHILLFLTPIFLSAHNALVDVAWGVCLPSFSDKLADVFTVAVLSCGAFFLLRRILLPQVRAITSIYDYVVLFMAMAPFLTGFLAYHQLFDYGNVITLHILSAELVLIAIPFTKLVHMLYFFLNRFLLVTEHSFGGGSRTW